MRCVGIPAGAVFSGKMTSLEISDMYFVKFDVFGQYLNNIWSMFVQQVSVQVYMSPNNITAAWAVDREFFLYILGCLGSLCLPLAPFGVPLGSLGVP